MLLSFFLLSSPPLQIQFLSFWLTTYAFKCVSIESIISYIIHSCECDNVSKAEFFTPFFSSLSSLRSISLLHSHFLEPSPLYDNHHYHEECLRCNSCAINLTGVNQKRARRFKNQILCDLHFAGNVENMKIFSPFSSEP